MAGSAAKTGYYLSVKLVAQIIVWGCVAALGATLVRHTLMRYLKPDEVSGLLVVLAGLSALATSTLVGLIKSYETAPPKELSSRRSEKMDKQFQKRRRLMWRRYVLTIIFCVLGGGFAWALKVPRFSEYFEKIGAVAGALLMCTIATAALALHEACLTGRVQRDLRIKLEHEKNLREALSGLRNDAER